MKHAAGLWFAAVIASSALVVTGALDNGPSGTIALLVGALPCLASAVFVEPLRRQRVKREQRRGERVIVVPSPAVYLFPLAAPRGVAASHRRRRRQDLVEASRDTRGSPPLLDR